MNKKVNLNLVLILAVAVVIAVPIAYALVEPSIIINMEVAQTTKPLEIKASNGTVVFSVDPNGTVFPLPVVGFQALRGAEQIVLNNNFDDGGGGSIIDTGISNPTFGAELTMPTTAPQWKISAVEIKTGNSLGGTFVFCSVIVAVDEPIPFVADNNAQAYSIASATSNVALTVSTVFKIPVVDSQFVDGGQDLIVFVTDCFGTGAKYADQARTNAWSTVQMTTDILINDEKGQRNFTVKATATEHYIVVYGVPYN